jgi:sirohydrochlorin cobaltochelatase
VPAPALLLVAHGSTNPQWREPLERVRDRARAQAPTRRVELCFLERCAPDVGEAIGSLHRDGVERVEVVALLLSGGGRHMTEDLPEALRSAGARCPGLAIELRPEPLGADPRVIEALASVALDADAS